MISAGAGSCWAAPAATANRYPDRIRRVVDDNSAGRRTERQGKMQGSLFMLALAQIGQRERETCRFVAPELDAEGVLVPRDQLDFHRRDPGHGIAIKNDPSTCWHGRDHEPLRGATHAFRRPMQRHLGPKRKVDRRHHHAIASQLKLDLLTHLTRNRNGSWCDEPEIGAVKPDACSGWVGFNAHVSAKFRCRRNQCGHGCRSRGRGSPCSQRRPGPASLFSHRECPARRAWCRQPDPTPEGGDQHHSRRKGHSPSARTATPCCRDPRGPSCDLSIGCSLGPDRGN